MLTGVTFEIRSRILFVALSKNNNVWLVIFQHFFLTSGCWNWSTGYNVPESRIRVPTPIVPMNSAKQRISLIKKCTLVSCSRTQIEPSKRCDCPSPVCFLPTLTLSRAERAHLQITASPSCLRWRSGAFSVSVVKYYDRLPASLVKPPSVFMSLKKQLDHQWSRILPEAHV